MSSEKERVREVRELGALAKAKNLTLPELRNHLEQMGFDVPVTTLRSWLYYGKTPSQEKQDHIKKLLPSLASLDEKPSKAKVLLRFKVTQKQIASAKRDKRFQAITVSGIRASKEHGYLVHLYESANGLALPAMDSCIWYSHVADRCPKSCCLFESLYQLLTNSPGAWISCQCQLQSKNFLTD